MDTYKYTLADMFEYMWQVERTDSKPIEELILELKQNESQEDF